LKYDRIRLLPKGFLIFLQTERYITLLLLLLFHLLIEFVWSGKERSISKWQVLSCPLQPARFFPALTSATGTATDLSEPCPRMNVRGERDHCPFGIQLFLSLRLKTLEELIPSSSIYVSILEEILILF
jgi:hypothetical protein